MADPFTFVAQAAAAGKIRFEIEFKQRSGATTDPSDQRDKWACRFVSPASGRVMVQWNNYEERDEMFETAARGLATMMGQQLAQWDNQLTAREEAGERAKAEAEAKSREAEEAARREREDEEIETAERLDAEDDDERAIQMAESAYAEMRAGERDD